MPILSLDATLARPVGVLSVAIVGVFGLFWFWLDSSTVTQLDSFVPFCVISSSGINLRISCVRDRCQERCKLLQWR